MDVSQQRYQRGLFEAWINCSHHQTSLSRVSDDGDYADPRTNRLWEIWLQHADERQRETANSDAVLVDKVVRACMTLDGYSSGTRQAFADAVRTAMRSGSGSR